MTIIAAIAAKHGSYIGCDSGVSDGTTTRSASTSKVIEMGEAFAGIAGSAYFIDFFRYEFKAEVEHLFETYKDKRESVYLFAKALREHVNEKQVTTSHEGNTFMADYTTILIVWGTDIYEVQCDYSIITYKDKYAAIGSGASFSLGAFFVMDDRTDPETRLVRALHSACAISPTCKVPIEVFYSAQH